MKLRGRALLLFVTLTSAAAGPAFGQVAPAIGPASPGGNKGSGSIPNLSGGWGHNFLLFEPPAAGPGPVVTKLHTPAGTLMFNAIGDYTNPFAIFENPILLDKDGFFNLPQGPGLGMKIREDFIDKG